MSGIGEKIQTADWKAEKHMPVIECPEEVKSGEAFTVTVSVGKEIPHPNTTEHFIAWIDLFFLPEGAKFPVHVGRYDFKAHGESAAGANQGPVHAEPMVSTRVKLNKAGSFNAISYCNIHGLWESSLAVKVV